MPFDSIGFSGYWDAAANKIVGKAGPGLRNDRGQAVQLYRVAVAGTTSLGGIAVWLQDDWAYYDGYSWGKFLGPNAGGGGGGGGGGGTAGRGVSSAAIDPNSGHLIITYTDATTQDVGTVVGSPGLKGDKGDKGDAGAQDFVFIQQDPGPDSPYVKRNVGVVMAGEYCKFDGTDDTSGWQAVMQAASQNNSICIEMPAGVTSVANNVIRDVSNKAFRLEGKGEGCTIFRSQAGSGQCIAAVGGTRTQAISMAGFTIWPSGENTGYAIAVDMGTGTDDTRMFMQEVGVTARDGWGFGGGLYLKKVGNGTIQFQYRGKSQTRTGAGIFMDGQCYGLNFDANVIFADLGIGFGNQSNAEEINIQGQLVYCNWGVYAGDFVESQNSPGPRGLRWLGGHMETFLGGINATSRHETEVRSGLIWKRDDATQDWIGVKLNNCVNSSIHDNRFWGRVNYTQGGNSTAVWLNNCNGTQVVQNRLAGNTYGVDPRNNTAAYIDGNTYDDKTTTFAINTGGGSVFGNNPKLSVPNY